MSGHVRVRREASLVLALTLVLVPLAAASVQQPGPWVPRPAPDDAPLQTARARIVDFGTDFLRDGDGRPVHQFHVHRYRLTRDGETGLWRPAEDYALDLDYDVDGDGRTDDDVVGHYPLSLSRPFSPEAPWYDRLAGTPRWYGAAAIFQADRRETRFSESGVNQEHDGPLHLPRDNWALFHEDYEVNSPYRAYGLWVWKKEDFLNGGADHRVSFEENSRMALCLQRYWMGWEGCRWLVKDGDRFYLSEETFRGAGQRRGNGDGKQHVIAPAAARWAEYAPGPPHDIAFEPEGANFRKRSFTDVRAVGWYLYKDRFIPAYTGFKWYAFEVDAVVRRPRRPSEHVEMSQVSAEEGVPPFYMSTCEVPYELWKNVFRLGRSNTYVRDPRGFIFRTDGDMGSMDLPAGTGRLVPHSPQEPVTDLTFHDVAAWCNALSTLESRTPCYYVDTELKKPFRFVTRSAAYVEERPLPSLHVRWDADGYRLPTRGEWLVALGGERPRTKGAWLAANSGGRTRPVGRRPPNDHGMHDMAGNVWELCWTVTGAFDPHGDQPILALGGGFRYPEKPTGDAASLFGTKPYGGTPSIGFRLVRRETGLPAPAPVAVPEGVPAWWVDPPEPGRAPRAAEPPKSPPVETVPVPGRPFEIAPHETTFAEWREIYRWAVANGYTFDHDGDMGSMDYWGFAGRGVRGPHSPDEPVTDISAYDAMVWCNALSELAGREPVYYADRECSRVYRDAFVHRPLMMLFFEAHRADRAGIIRYDHREAYEDVHVRPDADGYRLPTHEEFSYARTAGHGTRYSWGDEPADGAEHAWLFDTAGCTTHPVATGRPNPFGLYDMEGNVSEMGEQRRNGHVERYGGSFEDLTVGLRPDRPPFSPRGWGYPDIGFRVVRQLPGDAGTEEPESPQPNRPAAQLTPDASAYDPLKGTAYRGSLLRNGSFEAPGLRELEGLKWRFPTGGPVKSSPVLVDGVVYFGSNDGHVYAVSASTGRELWRVQTGDKVTGSAAVAGGVVYIAGEDGVLYAIEADTGWVRWRTRFTDGRPAGSPAVAYGVVFVPAGNRGGSEEILMVNGPTVGLDTVTGQKVWESGWGSQGYGSPAIVGEVLLASNQTALGAVDLTTGGLLWNVRASGQSRDFVGPAVADGIAYGIGAICGDVIAADVGTGRQVWSAFTLEGQVSVRNMGEPGYEILAPPAVADGRLYVGCNDGRLHTFDAADGTRGWRFDAGSPIQSGPSVAGGVVYFGCHDGRLRALDAGTGEQLWEFSTGDRIVSCPWPAEDTVYVGCDDGCLYAVAARAAEAPQAP